MTYVNSKFVYVEKRLQRHLNSLYRDVLEKKCNLERKVLGNTLSIVAQNPAEFALRLKGRPGYIGIVAGEVIYVARCTPVVVQPRETEECFNELPVSRNGEPMFLTPRTRILTHIGVKLVCDPKLPTVYRMGEKYIKLLPIRAIADAPTILRPETKGNFVYVESKYISRGGVYTKEDSERIRERTMFPIERIAVLNAVALGMLNGKNVTDEIDIEAFLRPEHLEGAIQGFMSKIWNKFLIFGSTSAGIFAIFLLIKIIKFGLDTVLHGIALHEIYGFSFHLLGAIWDSLTQLLLHWGTHRDGATQRNRKDGPTTTEEQPLDAMESNNLETNPFIPIAKNRTFSEPFVGSIPRITRNASVPFDRASFHGSRSLKGTGTRDFPALYPKMPRTDSTEFGTL